MKVREREKERGKEREKEASMTWQVARDHQVTVLSRKEDIRSGLHSSYLVNMASAARPVLQLWFLVLRMAL